MLPKSELGEALEYSQNQWPHLTRFAEDGRVPIDNNASERAIRSVAAGSLEGGRSGAILYSLVQTCRLLGVEPFEYLRDVLDRVSTHPARLVDELTPAGWKATRERTKAAAAPATV